jgi:secreted PhoX family phosphatase
MPMQDRRHFLKQASAFAVGFAGLHAFVGCKSLESNVGFGAIRSDPDGVFDLPEEVSYQIISRHGDPMDGGFRVPHRPDGTAPFPGPDGTIRNCAGGLTPGNSWLTCEETVQRANETLAKDRGYVFEVPATATMERATPRPITAMGRFNHEAVAPQQPIRLRPNPPAGVGHGRRDVSTDEGTTERRSLHPFSRPSSNEACNPRRVAYGAEPDASRAGTSTVSPS